MKKLLALTACLVFNTETAKSDDISECHAILVGGKFDRAASINESIFRSAATEYFCSNDFREEGDDQHASLKVVYEELTGAADYSRDRHLSARSEICSDTSNETFSSDRSVLLRQTASNDTIAAWSQCVSGQTNLRCDIRAVGAKRFELSVEWPDTPYNVDLVDTLLRASDGVTIEGGTLSELDKLTEGSRHLQTVLVEPNAEPWISFSGELNAGDRPRYSCSFKLPELDDPRVPSKQWTALTRILRDTGFSAFSARSLEMVSPENDTCQVRANETLQVSDARVNKELTKLSVSFNCGRPNFQYKCGAGQWSPQINDSFSGIVTANVLVDAGVLAISEMKSQAKTPETNCTSTVMQSISALNGRVLD